MEVGTLAELDVKLGDVVEWVGYEDVGLHTLDFINGDYFVFDTRRGPLTHVIDCNDTFRLISRAPRDPKTWSEMTDAEKVLDVFRGEALHYAGLREGAILDRLIKSAEKIIRLEPKRETVKIYSGWPEGGSWAQWHDDDDTHRITFDMIDGKPDCDSIRMEPI